MIKILIVEDTPVKLEKIKKLFQEETKPDCIQITEVDNVKSAKKLLYTEKFDLVILDLVLPFEAGDTNANFKNGIDFLEDIYGNPSIKQPIHIVGLTEFSELKPEYENKFHKQLNILIDYQRDSFNWREQLKGIIWMLVEKEEEFYKSRVEDYKYDIAIITAVEIEFKAVMELDANWVIEKVENDASIYYRGRFKNSNKELKVIAANAPQMGMNAAATLSMKLINNFRPKYLVMLGIAACTRKRETHGFGDILVADQSWDGGAGKITENDKGELQFIPSANYLPLDSDLKEKINGYKSNESLLSEIRKNSKHKKTNTVLQIHVGPIASVAGVTENKAVIEELKKHQRKIIGLEMETYGVFYSAFNCSNPKPKALSLKSICDFGDLDKNDSFQDYAAYTSAQFFYHFAKNEL
ncbi:response regulator [Ulvibacterium marinum]|uniref:phosphorylase family protein n=1 Tax=Ulvibacterium marinum TaxID=2419782 RepID=UPI00249546F1|nr:response regulator [Ulvibacterium marinum]